MDFDHRLHSKLVWICAHPDQDQPFKIDKTTLELDLSA